MRNKPAVFFGLLIFTVIYAQQAAAQTRAALPDQELLARVDASISYLNTDFSAEYVVVQDRPGQARTTTVAGVFRRDSAGQYTIVIMQPAISSGQGYIKEGNTLRFYDPQSRRFEVTRSASRFLNNSNARNSDFTRSTLAQDFRVLSGANEPLGRFSCRVLTLEAVTSEVEYPRMKVWICENNLLRKSEEYSLSGQLMRTTYVADYYSINGRFVIKQALYVDTHRGARINGVFVNESTQITINRPSFDTITEPVFSPVWLESLSR